VMPRENRHVLTLEQYTDLCRRLSGARERPRPDVLSALRIPRAGQIVTLADPPAAPALESGAATRPHEPNPFRLTQWTSRGEGWEAVEDRIELDIHGHTSMTHIDATSHFTSDVQAWPPEGSDQLLEMARTGLVSRGVLIDVPGVLGDSPAGRIITLEDVERVLHRTGLDLEAGDALYFHFGRRDRAESDVPLGSRPTAGLSIECAEWLSEINPTAVITDEGLDPYPSEVAGMLVPWHVLLLTALNVPLVDRAMLAPLSAACQKLGRWEFLSLVAPLPIPGASGSPVNPIAVL
jgi:kynurenine formamidase